MRSIVPKSLDDQVFIFILNKPKRTHTKHLSRLCDNGRSTQMHWMFFNYEWVELSMRHLLVVRPKKINMLQTKPCESPSYKLYKWVVFTCDLKKAAMSFGQMIKVARTIRPSTYEAIYENSRDHTNVNTIAMYFSRKRVDRSMSPPSYEYLKIEGNRFYFFRI